MRRRSIPIQSAVSAGMAFDLYACKEIPLSQVPPEPIAIALYERKVIVIEEECPSDPNVISRLVDFIAAAAIESRPVIETVILATVHTVGDMRAEFEKLAEQFPRFREKLPIFPLTDAQRAKIAAHKATNQPATW
ncbi:MAG TPA: hypothetical protein VIN59_01560 [Alphaproteobacteria bacterium]